MCVEGTTVQKKEILSRKKKSCVATKTFFKQTSKIPAYGRLVLIDERTVEPISKQCFFTLKYLPLFPLFLLYSFSSM